ncbi:hypothetical protein PYCCODRAFT_163606 [Trametes coccinea BRFM310]|uniref:Uncharacterized protein n=1 Tax=Trametes coccinea (strain BRFM310) TaxID=1353009 RepID=A0A1Y2IS31_TRAC3|nr:hypothetical protein PYCCODRAFT_163606 [Trametes coccinea BRFM310]
MFPEADAIAARFGPGMMRAARPTRLALSLLGPERTARDREAHALGVGTVPVLSLLLARTVFVERGALSNDATPVLTCAGAAGLRYRTQLALCEMRDPLQLLHACGALPDARCTSASLHTARAPSSLLAGLLESPARPPRFDVLLREAGRKNEIKNSRANITDDADVLLASIPCAASSTRLPAAPAACHPSRDGRPSTVCLMNGRRIHRWMPIGMSPGTGRPSTTKSAVASNPGHHSPQCPATSIAERPSVRPLLYPSTLGEDCDKWTTCHVSPVRI